MAKLNYEDQENWPFEGGKRQSPIDLHFAQAKKMSSAADLQLAYSQVASYAKDTGRGIEVGSSGQAMINQRPFSLQQFHFHAPSEHLLDGQDFPAEVHFVHEAADGQLAVIAVFLTVGQTSPAITSILHQLGASEKFACDVEKLLPKDRSYFHYLGSLTTPPLTETVEWYVMTHPVELSALQLKEFHQLYEHNNRKIQAMNDRPLLYFQAKEPS